MTIADRKATARRLTDAKRVVVKVGSALLVDARQGTAQSRLAGELRGGLAALRKRGQEVILVSSGAIALGRRHLGLNAGKLKLEESQAAAAVGQIRLAHAYKELLEAHEITVAQILLTLGDTEQRRRYLNARGTLNTLLSLGRSAGDQRERHGRDRRDPLRRQRPAGGARGADGGRRLPGAAVGHRRAVHGESARATRDAEFISARARHHPGHRGHGGRRRAAAWDRAACRPRSPPPKSRSARAAICASPRERSSIRLKRIEEGARCTWFVPSSTPVGRPQAVDRRAP